MSRIRDLYNSKFEILSDIAFSGYTINLSISQSVSASGLLTSNNTFISPGETVSIGDITYFFDFDVNVKASGTLTLTSNATNGQTVTIDSNVYTFQTSLTNVAGNVLIGATDSDSLSNLVAAINTDPGAGTLYAADTTTHPTVTALPVIGNTMDLNAKVGGTAGNSIATTETLTNGSFGGATLSGGAGGAPYRVKVGFPVDVSMTNLFNAINGTGGVAGDDYSAATTAHPDVAATNFDPFSLVLTVEALAPGAAGNDIAVASTSADLYWNNLTLTGGIFNVSDVSGILPAENGGTGLISVGTAHQLFSTNSSATANEYRTLSTGTSGNDYNIAFGPGTIILNIPDAGAGSRGLVTVGNQTLSGVKTFSNAPNLSSLTASRPLKLDGSKNITSATIDLSSSSDVSNTLPAANGGTGLSALGAANRLLSVNTGATANEYRSLSTGISGSDFNIVFGSGTITLNIPDAGASTRGLVTTGTQTFSGTKTFSSSPIFNSVTSSRPLKVDGSNVLTASTISLSSSSDVSGTLPPGNGGTGLVSVGTANQLLSTNTGATANEYRTITTGTSGSDHNITFGSGTITVNIPDASSSARGLVTTSAQTFSGIKTFSSSPVIPTPVSGTDAANKAYVDARPTNISLSFAAGTSTFISSTSASFAVAAYFMFPGTTVFGTPNKITGVVSTGNAGTSGDIRIRDFTNNLVITTVSGYSGTTPFISTFPAPANLPSAAAIFVIELRRASGSSTVQCNGLYLARE